MFWHGYDHCGVFDEIAVAYRVLRVNLEELQKLVDSATPGPWDKFVIQGENGEFNAAGPSHTDVYMDSFFPRSAKAGADASFIAAARTMMPKLIAVARAAKHLRDMAIGIGNASFLDQKDMRQMCEALKELERE